MSEKAQNVQDVFLNHLRKNKTPVTIFLVNGVKLQGIVTWFDNFSVLLRRDGHSQLVYKHAISTIMPVTPVQLFDGDKADAGLFDRRIRAGSTGKARTTAVGDRASRDGRRGRVPLHGGPAGSWQ